MKYSASLSVVTAVRYLSAHMATLLMTMMALSFVTAVLTGFSLNSAHAAGDFARVADLRVCHAVSAGLMIALGVLHMWCNRGWYRRLCVGHPTSWRSIAGDRWLSLQTLLFVVMAVTGIVIGLGGDDAIGIHQGCGLLLSVFVVVNLTVRLSRR